MARRLAVLPIVALVALVAVLGGCGGGDDSKASLDDSLGYLPRDAPLVAAIDTDTSGGQYRNIDKLLGRFPFGGQVKNQIKQSLGQAGTNYDKDIAPQLGNELVIGSPDARSLGDGAKKDEVVVVFEAKDGRKLRETIEKDPGQRKSGRLGGSDVYESDGGAVVVVRGNTAVGAADRPQLQAALERHDGRDKLTEKEFDAVFRGLPGDPVMRVAGDAQAILEADPQWAAARRVKWFAGLRRCALTVTAEEDGLAFDAHATTQGIGSRDLPIPAGEGSPPLARFGDYGAAQKNLTRTLRFAEATAKAVDPEGYARFERRKEAANRQLGIDIDRDLVDQLTGDTTVAGGLDGSWAARSQVEDPAAMRRTLARMLKAGRSGQTRYAEVDGLVEATDEDGDRSYLGVVDELLVLGSTPEAARQLAAVDPTPVAGAKGAFVFVADGEQIAKALIQRSGQGGIAGQFFTGPVGDLTGWARASPGGVRAHAKLKIE